MSSRPLPPQASGASRLLVAVMTAAALALGGSVAADARSAGAADAAFDLALRELVEMPGGPPGAIAIVQRGSSLRVHAFGVAALGASGRPRKNDYMRIASVTKAFSGAVALSLVDEGILSLDDTVGRWLPGQPSAWHAVTLRQLVGHKSGLPDFAESEAWREAVAGSLAVGPPPAALLAFVADEPLTFTPGTQ
jgi:D-alanyl-D-alanine carboxypeptidase